jgi:hypothetical protein
MGTIPGGIPVTGKIPDKKQVASPHGDNGHKPQASASPGKPYQAAKPQADNYESRTAAMKIHRESLSKPRSDR